MFIINKRIINWIMYADIRRLKRNGFKKIKFQPYYDALTMKP